MNFFHCLFLALFILGFGGSVKSQPPPKAILVDEVPNPSCEELWSRLDGFTSQIAIDSTSTATVEISGKHNDTAGNFYWDSMIRGYFQRRKVSEQRWRIVRTQLGEKRTVRFWLTPAGAQEPIVEPAKWPTTYPPGTKPFVFTSGDSYSVKVGVCLYVDEIALLSQALSANPTARVNIVIVVRNDRDFVRRKRVLLKKLVTTYSVDRSRIRFFKKVSRTPNPLGLDPDTEYWFLP